jgi:hypothetical protein
MPPGRRDFLLPEKNFHPGKTSPRSFPYRPREKGKKSVPEKEKRRGPQPREGREPARKV